MRAVVTDARYRMALTVIRSLGRRGIPVVAAQTEARKGDTIGFYSRYAKECLSLPKADDAAAYVQTLLRLGKKGDVLIPVALKSVFAASSYRDQLAEVFHLAVAPPESLELANDTSRLLELAASLGVPAPQTTTLAPGETFAELAERLTYPVVVKYRAGEELQLPPQERYCIVRSPDELVAVYQRMHARQPYPLAQEYVPGAGFGVSALFNREGEAVALFAHRRLREYPVSGGPSCFCESIYEPRLFDYALRLLRALRWEGVAMVEFKQDAYGEFRLMEINPRFWGSLPLAVAAGVDFPYLLYQVARGERPSPVLTYRLGVRMRYFFQDLLAGRDYFRRSESKRAFLARYLRDWLDPKVVDGVFSLRDPLPGMVYTWRVASKFFRQGKGIPGD